ncbi:Hypothetical predicted protein [Mytilus galloprovincialis]|uniref:Uncharacterized protein n=1 Tax=Mytilus galloprovincialis TaxID=29158 RepID=A0A8B6GP66_MYTGA|nr:Hypothetical predicted protein [Mytilus galloprovincialis]
MSSDCFCKLCGIIFLLALEITDLVLDWDFYVEVVNTTQEPINTAKKLHTAILVFAIFGTCACVASILVKIVCVLRKKDDTFFVILSLISTWFEDFPQIILAMIVAFKSSELIDNVQVIKAGYAIVEAVILILRSMWLCRIKEMCIKYCCCDCIDDDDDYDVDEENANKSWIKTAIIFDLIGVVIILLCAIILMVELQIDAFKYTNVIGHFANSTMSTWNATYQ